MRLLLLCSDLLALGGGLPSGACCEAGPLFRSLAQAAKRCGANEITAPPRG